MDYNVIGCLGLLLFFGGIAVGIFEMVRPSYGNAAFYALAGLVGGFLLIVAAGVMQNQDRASKCHEMGGIYLHRERACLPAETLKGRLP